MRFAKWWGVVCLTVGTVFAQTAQTVHEVPVEASAWQSLGADAGAVPGGLSIRQTSSSGTGVLVPRGAWPRRTMTVEADVVMRERLAGDGWNFAGVTLYESDSDYWMLALVEGPGGSHTVDFLENRAGVWQAQNQAPTALTREGSVSFAWKTGILYRLRLAFEDGKVTARIRDLSGGGAVEKSACFDLTRAPSVRAGRPGLIVRASAAECRWFRYGAAAPAGASAKTQVAVLNDAALPGWNQTANARLVDMLRARGFSVTTLNVAQLADGAALTGDAFSLFIVPQCDAVPAVLGPQVQAFAREGGHLLFLGGPFLDHTLWRYQGRWLDQDALQTVLRQVEPAHRPFHIGPAFDAAAWRRSCQNSRIRSTFRVVSEGPDGEACLRMDIADFQGWDVRQSPELDALFGKGDDCFTFSAKGDLKATQLAVEIIERDSSRWIATAPLTSDWQRVALQLSAFRYWKDSPHAKGRGGPGDRLHPEQAVRVCFGLSASHTAAVGAGAHTIWLADIGTAPDPLRAAGIASAPLSGSLESIYPRYKGFLLENARWADATERPCGATFCAIPRMQGAGMGRGQPWRFVPLMTATNRATNGSGVCEWLLLNNRFPQDGTVIAGFGYTDPEVWSSPEVLKRIGDTAARITGGTMLEAAGTEQFAYWPGETVRFGAGVRTFGGKGETDVVLQIRDSRRTIWRETVRVSGKPGVTNVWRAWTCPKRPGDYRFTARLSGRSCDAVSHGFSVLDPMPAPRDAYIKVRAGDFWLDGKKWYPVGVNFWPLYISGMDARDYSAGWLRNAYYVPDLVERDVAHLRDLGMTMVSIQTPPLDEYRNLLDFLRICKRYGIHANLYVGQASPLAFDDEALKAYLQTARLPGNATVFAYDTIWEPGNHVFRNDAARARWDADWRAWIEMQYGSIEHAEKSWGVKARRDKKGQVISPSDACFREDGAWRVMMAAYRRFMDNLTSRLWGRANRRLRELDPNHLVSFRQGNTLPYDFVLSGPVKHIDFICPEGYSISNTDEGEDAIGFITRYVTFTTSGKPVVWSEFGKSVWDAVRMAPAAGAIETQGLYSERFYRTALAAGANGTVPWWWVGGYRVGERSDYGIVGPDGTERPAARLVRAYGPCFKAPHDKPVPSVWFTFDRDAHAGGYWQAAFNEGAQAYRAAAEAGRTLGVRTAGTGTDVASMPLAAVGDVPCDAPNPLKYLDAEFNRLQILDAEGQWQEAGTGAEIVVRPGLAVSARVSVGNTQEAAWLGDSPQHHRFVRLAVRSLTGGEVLCVRSLPAGSGGKDTRVPYLGDADFGEFDLLPAPSSAVAAKPVQVSVRMELVQREGLFPFGEARVFTLRPKK